ncbi:SET domain-containing protein [Trametes versicolor FP-101664 SS1]|uniref:SET domain-containing protein n=1 Tax=Trametes versicolor (strain FP-101664) TaxID=717944 RepID=UPI00046247E9|nr:SET domain-containing protein [Trametes versicolor FP-101664 SS1]EIW56718.1 SET domain-containing protein [Trametes versicolor FP-101664 SS1]
MDTEIEPYEPLNVVNFKSWLVEHGADIHPDAHFEQMVSGFSILAANDIPADAAIVSIPFSLAITPEGSKDALQGTLKVSADAMQGALDSLSERQLICTYLCMHWIADRSLTVLRHGPYLDTLPSPERLVTPLHFTSNELEAFRGTNLYGATIDRQRDWEAEWVQCQAVVSAASPAWGKAFTWDRYLTTSTYLSSRAFPSTVLSQTPTLHTTPSSYPVLLPGIDALNHARAHPVSWVVSDGINTSSAEPHISLVIHTPTTTGSELLNNYGPKPNAELILGYGFSLPNNPDDTIVLKIGGPSGAFAPVPADAKFEVGRNARGAEPVWDAVLAAIGAQYGEDEEEDGAMEMDTETETAVEDELCAADMLAGMVQSLYDRLPPFPPANVAELRAPVVEMLEHYLEGQRDILRSLVAFAQEKEARALQRAKEEGLDIVEEEDEMEE